MDYDDTCPHGHDTKADCVWVEGPCYNEALNERDEHMKLEERKSIVEYGRTLINSVYPDPKFRPILHQIFTEIENGSHVRER